tara:strand:- start:1439 stop:1777 length:339 start_codon:yes stop_codon:yes gene_type:complete
MREKGIRYQKKARPGLRGKTFQLVLDTTDLKKGDILTYDKEHGHCMMVWKTEAEDNLYEMLLITMEPRDFMPPEHLRPNTVLYKLKDSPVQGEYGTLTSELPKFEDLEIKII